MEESFDEEDEVDLTSIMYKEKHIEPKQSKNKEKGIMERFPQPEMDLEEFEKRLLGPRKKTKVNKPKEKVKEKVKENVKDEDIIKQKTMMKLHIGMWINQFPEELKSYKKVNLDKKSLEDLKDLVKEFTIVMDSKNDLTAETQAAIAALQAYEYLMVEYVGVNCTGITNYISNDLDSIKQIKLLILKHSPLVNVGAESKLIMKVLMATLQLHTINTMNQELKQPINNEKIETINKEYNDI